MTRLFWTLPPSGDGRSALRHQWNRGDFQRGERRPGALFTDERPGRYTYYDHLVQIARAAEVSTFDGVFVPWDPAGEDPWIVAAALAREARGLTFLPEVQAAFATPVYLAKMSVSFQRFSKNRLAWKLDVERSPEVRRAHGDFLDGDDWFERADEYLEAAKGVFTTHPYEFRGRFYDVEAGGFEGPLAGVPVPRIYTSGRSEGALALAAKHADTHVIEAGARAEVQRELARLGAAASARGRSVEPALRLAIIARHTREEAWNALAELRAEAGVAQGQALDTTQPAAVFAGLHEVGFDADVGLVDSYRAVAEQLDEYRALGVGALILTSNPHLEEAYRLGEHVFSKLSTRTSVAARVAPRELRASV